MVGMRAQIVLKGEILGDPTWHTVAFGCHAVEKLCLSQQGSPLSGGAR